MNTTTIITGVGAVGAAGALLIDWKEKKINKDNAQLLALTSASLTAASIGAATLNNAGVEKIHQKYSSAYVESMTDEQLEEALIQMNLLLPAEDSQIEEKII